MQHEQDSEDPTGIRDLTPKGNSDVARARERKANAALQLSLSGASWDEIAEHCGFPDARRARVAVELALENGLFTDTSQEKMRAMASKRLDRLLRAVWGKAINTESPEQLAAAREARAIVADHAKLNGYMAPQQVIVTPAATELEAWVSKVIASQIPELEEGDIFDVEYTEDEGTG